MSDQQPTVHRSRGKRYLRAVSGQGSEAKNVHGADCGTERNGTCGGGCKCWCHARSAGATFTLMKMAELDAAFERGEVR